MPDNVVVLASISQNTNLTLIENNLLKFPSESWDCLTLQWQKNSNEARLREFLRPRCDVSVSYRSRWGDLVNWSRPLLQQRAYTRIFLLLDDVELVDFDIGNLVDKLSQNPSYGVLSPRVVHATHSLMEKRFSTKNDIQEVSAVEQYATLYTRNAWECMSRLMDSDVLGSGGGIVGWGLDICYRPLCVREAGRVGIAESMKVRHIGSKGALYTLYKQSGPAYRQMKKMRTFVKNRQIAAGMTPTGCESYHSITRLIQ